MRNLLHRSESVRALAYAAPTASLLQQLGCPESRPVRALFFDKNPEHNWKVPWHQDLSIAVTARIEMPGFQAWSLRTAYTMSNRRLNSGPHGGLAIPPGRLRTEAGPLRVLPGSHRHGRLDAAAIMQLARSSAVSCHVGRGGVVALRPLILHASSPAFHPSIAAWCISNFPPTHCPANWLGLKTTQTRRDCGLTFLPPFENRNPN